MYKYTRTLRSTVLQVLHVVPVLFFYRRFHEVNPLFQVVEFGGTKRRMMAMFLTTKNKYNLSRCVVDYYY